MNHRQPYLTKSRYIDGLHCEKKLWLGWHEPLPYEEPKPFSPQDVGTRVGKDAHELFPGGIEVTEKPWEHKEAVQKTQQLMADQSVPAIFEAAFEFNGIRVRVDILERMSDGGWGLREVKSVSAPNAEKYHYHDVAIQLHVLKGCDVRVTSVELVHVNKGYVRGEGEIGWSEFFSRTDVATEAEDLLPFIDDKVADLYVVLNLSAAPESVVSKSHCLKPHACPFWEQCTADKPEDWVELLPNFNAKRSTVLRLNGIESIRDVPSDFKLRDKHRNIQRSVQTAREIFSEDLSDALAPLEAPAFYLDFETFSPVEPIYPETSPRQRIPFQWSIHYEMTTSLAHEDGNEGLEHFEFLADGSEDPRRELAESMLDVLRDTDYPIIVYNQSFELGVIEDLAVLFPDITVELRSLKDRVQDLLPIVRDHLTHPALFTKSALKSSTYSIKNVLPVLAPDLDYVDLEGVQDGGDATTKYEALVRREITGSDAEQLRSQLLRYCELDTYAMVRVRHALLDRAST